MAQKAGFQISRRKTESAKSYCEIEIANKYVNVLRIFKCKQTNTNEA